MRAGKREGFEVDGGEGFDYHFGIAIARRLPILNSVIFGIAGGFLPVGLVSAGLARVFNTEVTELGAQRSRGRI